MDNASKALVIIGGVLISIMIISVAMYVFTSARGVAQASEDRLLLTQKASFNRFFINYPNEITGLDVYNIIGKIDDINNNVYSLGNIDKSSCPDKSQVTATASFTQKYSYSYTDIDGDGLIDKVIISEL